MIIQAKPTQRAYTLRLCRPPGKCTACGKDNCDCWREALWRTHAIVNHGAKVFGEWLLTLRGGLCHTLAGEKVARDGHGAPPDPTADEVRDRRILLALSWLTVESERGAPAKFIVARGKDDPDTRARELREALKDILRKRGLNDPDIASWVNDCMPSLSAAIREDAVWVNRSAAFDEAVGRSGGAIDRREVWKDMLERFLGPPHAYLAPLSDSEDEESAGGADDGQGKNLVKDANGWLSNRFGPRKGADFPRIRTALGAIAAWAANAAPGMTGTQAIQQLAGALGNAGLDVTAVAPLKGVLKTIGGPGVKSGTRNVLKDLEGRRAVSGEDLERLARAAEKDREKKAPNVGRKGARPYADMILRDVERTCGFTYLHPQGPARQKEFAVMLDHAARRVRIAHAWIKRAEAERRRFEEDAHRIDKVPPAARTYLDRLCESLSAEAGAIDGYRIRRRALGGNQSRAWKALVAEWSRPECATADDRKEAVRRLQSEWDDEEKFGHEMLFTRLAEDDAICVWRPGGEPDPQPLIDYAAASDADYNRRRFKVPAYRHPDALFHPVFCDFGCSRWGINFAIHQTRRDLLSAEQDQQNAATDRDRQRAQRKLDAARQALGNARTGSVSMALWTGADISDVPLRWQCKRLRHDLALRQVEQQSQGPAKDVPRADRLGRAAGGAAPQSPVNIVGLFEQKYWNGRLQAPRAQLEAIGKHVDRYGWDARALRMAGRLKWLVTLSAEFTPLGPWLAYAARFGEQAPARPFVSSKGDCAIRHSTNDRRKGLAKLILSRLPGLRVLAVDIGHRCAAACAVWQTLSADEMLDACNAAGHRPPTTTDLFLHLKTKVVKQNGGTGVESGRTTIYRRIGADVLPDGTPHPAPWAKLEREFLIRLQGEERLPRIASADEIWMVHCLERELGVAVPLLDRVFPGGQTDRDARRRMVEDFRGRGWTPLPLEQPGDSGDSGDDVESRAPSLRVDELMAATVRTLRLALQRHGDAARIACALAGDFKPMPGGRRYWFTEAKEASASHDADTRRREYVEHLLDVLLLWHGLFSSRKWKDDIARALWDEHIATVAGYKAIEEPSGDVPRTERRKLQEQARAALRPVAEALADNRELRGLLHEQWKKRWEADDGCPAVVARSPDGGMRKSAKATGWYARLRQVAGWLMPSAQASLKEIRRVGGLSLTRLSTLADFRRRVQVAFYTRLRPDGARCEISEDFGKRTLDAMERLREQRIKQLASRILEAALGVGRMKRPDGPKDPARPRQRVDEPCHAVVIENLERYRPDEVRTRRENRQLMTWAARNVRKYLQEACHLHGLHLREVPANYTSRQDSRTGAPGVRCQDVPVIEFMQSPFWRTQVAQAERKQAENNGDARSRFLCDLNAKWKDRPASDWKRAGAVRIPLKGGELFMSARPCACCTRPGRRYAGAIHADLNAAANIGLRALLDPDFGGRWWYVPCDPETLIPVDDRMKGGPIDTGTPLSERARHPATPRGRGAGRRKGSAAKSVVNLWRDLSAELPRPGADWRNHAEHWNTVQAKVVEHLRGLAQLAT